MVRQEDSKECIARGETALGIEFGSTRIKAVLINLKGNVLAVGFHDWENSLVNGVWTYSLEEIHSGIQDCYANLKKEVRERYGVTLHRTAAIGISAMMHGYMAFDRDARLLAPFQTWRNSNTQQAADTLTELFQFNIPLRWTIAHLYQCVLDEEQHLYEADFVTTLASYMHWKLTGRKVTGIGDASGIFPVDSRTKGYDSAMLQDFDVLVGARHYPWKAARILPEVLTAGQPAGNLTEEGAAFLDPEGDLVAGIPFCPPEGDAGTGMTATNAVAPRTGNVSAGTSTFAMIVLEKPLSKVYREIDMVTTPTGFPVAMSHANNGTSDLNAWVSLFQEFSGIAGMNLDAGQIYEILYRNSLKGDPDCGGLLSYGYYSGEGITHLKEGRPLFVRMPDSNFNLANFMRSHLYSSIGAVALGLDILFKEEGVKVNRIMGHGGLFKTRGVAQKYLAAAVNAPVTVLDTAAEGGPWGMALLASYLVCGQGRRLEDYLEEEIFTGFSGTTVEPDPADAAGFGAFKARYREGLSIEEEAIRAMR